MKGESAEKDHLNQAKMQRLISLQREIIEYQKQTKRLEDEVRDEVNRQLVNTHNLHAVCTV